MVDKLPLHLIPQFQQIFQNYDPKGEGIISINNLKLVLTELGYQLCEDDLQKELYNEADQTIEFLNFLTLMEKKVKNVDESEYFIQKCKLIDKNNSGLISEEDFEQIFDNYFNYLTKEEKKELMKEIEKIDGNISYKETISCLINK